MIWKLPWGFKSAAVTAGVYVLISSITGVVEAPKYLLILVTFEVSGLAVEKSLETGATRYPFFNFALSSYNPYMSPRQCLNRHKVLKIILQMKSGKNFWEDLFQETGPRNLPACLHGSRTPFIPVKVTNEQSHSRADYRTQHFGVEEHTRSRDEKQRSFLVTFHEHHVILCTHSQPLNG